ncbi:MAG TPA: acyl-CoA synthetase, partial [Psychromonas hadalis]|nr:acyl-CoA synthetase [Psychromonas hadalis]
QRIAICCEDSYYFSVAFFGAFYANKNVVLPGNHQPAMLASLTMHFDLMIDDGLLDELAFCLQLKLPLQTPKHEDLDFPSLILDKLTLTLFTSGSSGDPKSIVKTLAMLDKEITVLDQCWGEKLADSQIVSTVSHQHIYGLLFRVLWPLCAERAFDRHDLLYPEQISQKPANKQTLISSPALLKRLNDIEGHNGYCAIFSSGGPLPEEAAFVCKKHFLDRPIEVFGSTETGGIGYRQQTTAQTPWSFFPSINATLSGDHCLALKSPWIDENHWYQTSDQCELLTNNQFILKGRVDRIVKVEEKRVSLIEVENQLNALKGVEESAVITLNEGNRISLAAVLVLTTLGAEKMQEIGKGRFWILLRNTLRKWLEPVAIPRHFRLVDEIEVNKQGKRSFLALSALFEYQK